MFVKGFKKAEPPRVKKSSLENEIEHFRLSIIRQYLFRFMSILFVEIFLVTCDCDECEAYHLILY